ncbi:dihydrofolate reductase [Echinicola rosea]|uniref:Dihydrofolate reductase n=1 Tax=Echinicola rosea TaxID=1807691 RepID=A0ABQ1V488_9BACT|nr:dihydrofolate reductase [Echinicola rosea]GGF37707.1 dihydrofolate reductase [Echinicola rosea]
MQSKNPKALILSIIVAKANNNVIGKDNQLIWRLSADLRHFKQQTTGHYIIMGRKTYESMGKPLPNRTSVVITRNRNYQVPEGHYVVHGLGEAIDLAKSKGLEKAFVIGGAEIYKQALPCVDEMVITEVNCAPEGDAFFPEFPSENWKKTSEEFHEKDDKNQFDYTFVTYQKVNPSQA